jgi:membrane-associated protein
MVDRFLEWILGLPPFAVYAVLIALSAVENVFPPVPADVAVLLGAFLAQRGLVAAPLLGVLCWAANCASSAAMYFYARSRGRAFLETGWPRRFMPPPAVEALERAYARHGTLGIFVSRFLPGVRAAVTPFAGLLGISPARALIPAATASALWYAFLIAAGTALGLNWERARHLIDSTNRVLGLLSVAITAAIVIWIWRRSRDPRKDD